MMNEFRVMYNCYDGKGDVAYKTYHNMVEAIEVRRLIENWVLKDKGSAWIQVRKVTEWKNIKIK